MGSTFGAGDDRPDNLAANDEVGLDMKHPTKPPAIRLNDTVAQFRSANPARHISIG